MLGGSLLSGPLAGSSAGPYDITYLSVAGGGGGGSYYYGGGGGGGGLLEGTLSQMAPEIVMTITVGSGGVGASNGQGSDGTNSLISGSGITTITSIGGGGGGGSTSGSSSAKSGRNGGSGGGPRAWSTAGALEGTGVSGQGYMSGSSLTTSANYVPTWITANYLSVAYGAGGGGANGRGRNSHYGTHYSQPGRGGTGKTSYVNSNSQYYSGGGGGGWNANSNATNTLNAYSTRVAPGGLGGGGTGGRGYTQPHIVSTAGGTNLGGGGGGGSHSGATNGANGGSGVVLIKVPEGNYSGIVTGSPTITTSGGYTYIKFTGSGTYTT